MRKCFAIPLLLPNRIHTAVAKMCVKSIRKCGYEEDILVVTCDPSLEIEGAIVQCFPPIEHPSLEMGYVATTNGPVGKKNRPTDWCDLNKIRCWQLDYDKVHVIDSDMIFHTRIDYWDLPDLTACKGGLNSPICSASMVLQPDGGERLDLLMRSTFSWETGWNNIGEESWFFQAANAGQGFFYYYAKYIKKSLHWFSRKMGWEHFGGERKWNMIAHM